MTTPVSAWLEQHGAHHDVVEWARPYGEEWERAWRECPRGDWLLGLAARIGMDRVEIVRAAQACAALGLDYVPDEEARPRAALDAIDRWLEGADDADARARACTAIEAAMEEAPDPAVNAAAMAVFAALRSIDSPDEAATAAAAVVQAAVLDAGDCAMMSALRYVQHACAERVRQHVTFAPPA